MVASRRLLAAPFVVTVAAGCHGAEAPVSHNPPELGPVATATATVAATPTATPASAPIGAPTATATPTATTPSTSPTTPQTWLVKESAGKCTAEILPDCAQFPCTGSKPVPYPCPPASEFPATVRRWSGQVVCIVHTSPAMHCPPTATCNPPPPQYARVPCPDRENGPR